MLTTVTITFRPGKVNNLPHLRCNFVCVPRLGFFPLAYLIIRTWRPYDKKRRQEKTTRETSQAMERRPGQILEQHDLAVPDDSRTRQANLDAACWGLCITTRQCCCQWWWWLMVLLLLHVVNYLSYSQSFDLFSFKLSSNNSWLQILSSML